VTLVPDASVVIKWFVPEVNSREARALLDADNEFVVPDLLFAEVANAIGKKTGRGEIAADEATALLRDVQTVPFEIVSSAELGTDPLEIAVRAGCSVFDATYLALAARLETVLVTADDRLVERVRAFPLLSACVEHVARRR
jgi:predicted nucleic acid-binding protein